DEQLESTRAEMGEVKQENERLKTMLARILKDYQSLQMHFFEIVQQNHQKNPAGNTDTVDHGETEESELVSLSLGRTSSGGHKNKEEKIPLDGKAKEGEQAREGLSLRLDCKFDSSSGCRGEPDQQNSSRENSLEELKEEEAGEPWPPSKILKTLRSGEDDVSQQPHLKKARVSVRARCDAPTMNDGCQWRKYGQKIAKGNPCPRAYYRCTVAPACPVRKQVQRCAEDMSILITTYEGTHNHPLPISATAMASTTSAAACMLMSGPLASPSAIEASSTVPTASAANGSAGLRGLNFGLSDAARQRQLYFPNPSLSPSPSYPTITLDLTSPSSSSPSTQFSRFSSNFPSTTRYGPTNFNFSSLEASATAPSWSSGHPSYGAQPYSNKSEQLGFFNLGRQPQDQLYQSYLQKVANAAPPVAGPNGQQALTETIAAATKAITSDPSFQSALAAAITSIVGGQGGHGAAETTTSTSLSGHVNQLKWEEQLPAVSAPPTTSATGNGCASTYLTRSTSSNPKPPALSNLMFPQPSLTISSCKSASASPVRNRD
ncbi:hypothetical protein Taro_003429, partial [Colocasia esculenta]|nr:hypothetical protein [Colocasia esculenta]